MSKTRTTEYRAWKRLSAVPDLFQAIKNHFSYLPPPAVVATTGGHRIKARALQALRAKRIDGPLEIIAYSLVMAVKVGEPKDVLFFPALNSYFLEWPGELGVKSIWAGHPPSVRMAVDCEFEFCSHMAIPLHYELFDDADVRGEELDERLRQLGLPLSQYFDTYFGDMIYSNEADYLEYGRSGNIEPRKGLSYSRLAKLLQLR
jgi:hypothetical protein